MELKDYLNQLPPSERQRFAADCGTSLGYLRKAISVGQFLSAAVCVCIERLTKGAVTRAELRPRDYWLIWPDLSAPSTPNDSLGETP